MAEKPQLVKVLYCPVCSLPAEYCEFGPDFEKCKPWLIQNAPELYPGLLKEANEKDADKVSERLQSVGISSDGAASSAQSGQTSSAKPEEVKRLPGGKIKKKDKQEVIIEKVVRNRRKCITMVKGLDLFGVKLSDASKKLGKKFATGASVVKGPTEKDQIDVQGDIAYDVVDFITETWPDLFFTTIFYFFIFFIVRAELSFYSLVNFRCPNLLYTSSKTGKRSQPLNPRDLRLEPKAVLLSVA